MSRFEPITSKIPSRMLSTELQRWVADNCISGAERAASTHQTTMNAMISRTLALEYIVLLSKEGPKRS
jgi:hypothetical protein